MFSSADGEGTPWSGTLFVWHTCFKLEGTVVFVVSKRESQGGTLALRCY